MLLWLLNMGFAGGGTIVPPNPPSNNVSGYTFYRKDKGGSGDDESVKERIKRDDDEVLYIIKMFIKCQ